MSQTKDTVKRSIVKTIFFKIVTTGTTTLFMGLGSAILLHAILTAFYLLYERVWNNIKWGKVSIDTSTREGVEVNTSDFIKRERLETV